MNNINKILAPILVLVVVVAVILKQALFIVTEGEQAIITQFGKPVGEPITQAGLYFKTPFIQDARYIDKRILSWDGYPNQIPTKDKKFISVDTTARWRVVDSLKFIQTVRSEQGARSRLDTILDSITRDVISNSNLVEAVRNSNNIIDQTEARRLELEKLRESGEVVVEDEITGEIEPILIGRERLSLMIAESADEELKQFGIELVDVQLRRISYEKSVESSVYDRMISERQRIAQKIRSIGQGERARIEGRMVRDLRRIESEAYRSAQEIRGTAEARAAQIYAQALNKDPKFYEFLRTMEAYGTIFNSKTNFILSTDSDLLKYLKGE